MIKRFYALILMIAVSVVASAQTMETAQQAVSKMKVGWNLGNTLDSNAADTTNMWMEWTPQPIPSSTYETAWGQPLTTRELIHMFKQAGFNAIRVPVTWYQHMGIETKVVVVNGEYKRYWYKSQWKKGTKVDAQWMARVKEIVDYVIDEGMYCILNVHHDTGAHNASWITASTDSYAQNKERFEGLWTEIATEFRDYDEHLLFEGYNEMLDPYNSWCFASFATSGQYNATVATSAYNAVNSYAQSFVDAVRATGGNNAERNLICNTYAACCGDGTWNSHLTDPLTKMKKPVDTAKDHLIFEVHFYPDVTNITTTKTNVTTVINRLKSNLQTKAPVIIGEWGAADGTDRQKYGQNILAFAKYMVQKAKAADMATFYWMGLSDGADRAVPKWTEKSLAEAILKGYYGDSYDMTGITGDVNRDGKVTVADAKLAADCFLGKDVTAGSSVVDVEAADVNHDSKVSMSDANAISNIAVRQ